jgi:autotransporter-associated beta strand protein
MNKNLVKTVLISLAFLGLSMSSAYALEWSGTKTFNEDTIILENITLTGNVVVQVASGAMVIIDAVISAQNNAYTLTKTGLGTIKFLKNNTYKGLTTISAGELYVGNYTPEGNVAGDIDVKSGAILFFSRDNIYTYPGVISGAGEIRQWSKTKLILTGTNTHTGIIRVINYGLNTLQIGNGTSGSIAQTAGIILENSTTLRLEPGKSMTINADISGTGKVEYKGAETKELGLRGKNTYTGTTTIESGQLYLNSVVGDISVAKNARIVFSTIGSPNLTFTYSGVISGEGGIGTAFGNVILTGDNTYTGRTWVSLGTIQVGNGGSGSIKNTSDVRLENGCTLRFEPGENMVFNKVISGTGNVVYKGGTKSANKSLSLTGNNTFDGKIIIEEGDNLKSSSLYISGSVIGDIEIEGNSALYFNQSFDFVFTKTISGTGNVFKTGNGKLTLSRNHPCTGDFTLEKGSVEMSGKWSGNFIQNKNTSLYVNESVQIDGVLTLHGGNIHMNLATAIPSKISARYCLLSDNEKNALHITSSLPQVNDKTILETIYGGITTTPFITSMPGYITSLSTTPENNELRLTAIKSGFPWITGKFTGDLTFKCPYLNYTKILNAKIVTLKLLRSNYCFVIPEMKIDEGIVLPEFELDNLIITPQDEGYDLSRIGEANIIIPKLVIPPTPPLFPSGETIYNCPFDVTLLNAYLENEILTIEIRITSVDYESLPITFDVSFEGNFTEVGIEQLRMTNDELRVYPNPTHGQLTITNDELRITNVEVFDIYGRAVSTHYSLLTTHYSMDISAFPAGIYFLRVETDKGMITKKVIKSEL